MKDRGIEFGAKAYEGNGEVEDDDLGTSESPYDDSVTEQDQP